MMAFEKSSFLVPRMETGIYLPRIAQNAIKFLSGNHKQLNAQRMEPILAFLDTIPKRYMSLTQKHTQLNEFRKNIAL